MRGISEDHHAKAGGKNWRVRVRVYGKEQTLGRWHTAEEAETFLTQYWAKVMPDTVPWLFSDYLERVSWYTEQIATDLRSVYPDAELPLPSQILAKRQEEAAKAAQKAASLIPSQPQSPEAGVSPADLQGLLSPLSSTKALTAA